MSLFSSKKSFDSSKCVSLLEVTQKRIGILRKKRSIIAKQSREDVATLLGRGQDANAAARAEHVYREENITGAYEVLEQHCQLVIKGISAIKSEKGCSPELKEAIASLIYAAPRCGDLQELQRVRDLFATRYGPDYVTAILELRPGCAVNAQIIQKLSSRPPNSDVRLNLLKGIALEYKIEWNYQRAVAASFKNGEVSEKAKVSPSASKGGLADDGPSPNSVDAKPKEPAASSAAQSTMPVKASVVKSEFEKTKQSSDVSRDPAHKGGDKGQASSARQNSAPSMIHDIKPRERDGISPNKVSSIASLRTVDESMRNDRSMGNASLPTHNSAPPTMHIGEPRKEDFANTKEEPAAVGKQRRSPFLMHQNNEQKGHPSSEAKGNASLRTHDSAPPTMHKAQPRKEDFANTKEGPAAVGKQRGSSFLMHQNDEQKGHPSSEAKGNASLPTHNSAPPTMHKTESSRKEDFTNTKEVPAAVGKQRRSSFLMHQNDERKGHLSSEAHQAISSPTTRARYEDRLARPDEHTSLNAEHSTERALHPNREFSSKAKVATTPSSAGARVSETPGVLGRPMQQAASTPAFNEAKVFSSKPEPLYNGESLAAKQYLRAHESYVKVDTTKMHEDLRSKGVSQIKFQSQNGASNPEANPPPYNKADAHVESMAVKYYKEHKTVHQQPQDQKSSHKAMSREEDSTINKDRAEGYLRGTHQEMHERSRGREGSYSQARHQLEDNLSEQKYSTIPRRRTPRPSVPSELRSMKEGVDQELEDLEIAIASAARAADAAIDMVRTCSMRSRADKKDVGKRERNSQTQNKNYGGLYSETGSDARRAFHNPAITKGDLDHKQPYQEQEPVSLDSERPHFDDYSSSDDSEEPPLYSKGRLPVRNQHVHVDLGKPSNMSAKPSATAFTARGQHDFSRETLHISVNRNSQNEMVYDDDCAASVDSYSPRSSSSSHQHHSSSDVYPLQSGVQPDYKPQLDEYKELDNGHVSRVLPFRRKVYAGDEKLSSGWHGLGNDRGFDTKLANENADRGELKWQGSAAMPTGDVGKKKWTLGNVQPPSQPYKQHDAMATEGKFQGVSRRSVRS